MRLTACIIFSMTAFAQDGKLVFTERCSVCHGDGHGTERGPNLANSRRVRSRSLQELRSVIRDGIPASGMPAFPLPAAELEAVTAYVRSMSAVAAESNAPGNRAAGEQFFFGKGHCAGCHMALGRGKAVGPDLSAVGREMTLAEVDEAVRRPSARIKPGYHMVTVQLRDGHTVRGFARNQSRYNIQVQDLAGQVHLLKQEQIAELIQEPGSLMPAQQCSETECRDLLAFLSSLTGVEAGVKAAPMESAGGLTFERIVHPKPGDWPTYHGDIGGNRHSTLNQITAANVKNLSVKWVFPVNHFALEVTPLVVDGVMFITGPNQVLLWMGSRDELSGTISESVPRRSREIPPKAPTAAWRCWGTVCFSRRTTPTWSHCTA